MMSRMLNKSERVLPDKDMDEMFHALGRPVDIHWECYRNDFCTGCFSEHAVKFTDSANWDFVKTINDRTNSVFRVSKIGVQILGDYLDGLENWNDDPEATCH